MSVMLILNSHLIHSPDQGSLFCHRRCFNETCEYETSPLSQCDSSGRIRPHRLLLNNVSGVSRRRYAWMFGGRKGGCKARQGRGLLSWCQVHVWRRPARGEVSTPTTPFWSKFTSIAASFTGSNAGKKSHRSRSRGGASNSTEGGWWCHWSCSPQQPVPHTS